jgi:hypothetical protein
MNRTSPQPEPASLAALAAGGRVAVLPARLLEPSLALLAPFAPITAVQSPPHAHDDIMVQTAHRTAWSAFTPESWAMVFVPDDPAAACSGCGRYWSDGCAPACTTRVIADADVAAALDAAGLTGGWSAAQILEARP